MLSIIIPTHQRTDLLQKCLRAVTRHAPKGSEIVVVDDGSPAAAASATALEFGAHPVRLRHRRGFAAAANVGIRASRGDIVEMLNDDTEVQAGWADAALPWFADETIGAVAPLVLVWPDGKIIDSAGDRYYLGGVAGKRGHGTILPSPPGSMVGGEGLPLPYTQPCPVFGTSAAAGFYRRSALARVGLFPEEFGSYFEDVDLAFRLQRAGFRAMYEPASRVLHHVSASYGRLGRCLIERQSCNEERVFWRNLPASVLRRALAKHLAVLLGKAWRRLDEGTLLPWMFGRLRVAWEWQTIMQERVPMPSEIDVAAWGIEEPYWS